MNLQLATLAALSLLISGCATNSTVAPPAEPNTDCGRSFRRRMPG